MLNVYSTGEKIYIESDIHGGCVARLCKMSAELYSDSKVGESRLEEYVLNCPFEKFQEIVKHKYGIEIDDEHRPDWSTCLPISLDQTESHA
jgi:hypothetical protein